MTLGELLAWLDRSGATVRVKAGKPSLALPPGWDLPPDVADALRENRGYFLSLVPADDVAGGIPLLDWPYWCGGCERQVHCADPAVVWQECGRVQCPFWRPAYGPEWMDSARWWWNKRAAERRAADRSQAEGIPE